MSLSLRPLTPADFPLAARIHVEVKRSAYASFFPPEAIQAMDWQEDAQEFERWQTEWPDAPFGYIAEVDGAPVGFIMAGRVEDDPDSDEDPHGYDCEIFKFFVLPDHQKRGIGRRLLLAVVEELIGLGCQHVCLWTYGRGSARVYYHSLGGQEVFYGSHTVFGHEMQAVVFGWDLTTLRQRLNP